MEPTGAVTAVTPPRRPGSIRRTITYDCVRPDGLDGPVTAIGRGRDLLTGADGSTRPVDQADIEIQVRFADGIIQRIDADPALPGLEALVGAAAYSEFRAAAGELVPEGAAHGVQFQLLDDLPITVLLSGRSLRAEASASAARTGRHRSTSVPAGSQTGSPCGASATSARP